MFLESFKNFWQWGEHFPQQNRTSHRANKVLKRTRPFCWYIVLWKSTSHSHRHLVIRIPCDYNHRPAINASQANQSNSLAREPLIVKISSHLPADNHSSWTISLHLRKLANSCANCNVPTWLGLKWAALRQCIRASAANLPPFEKRWVSRRSRLDYFLAIANPTKPIVVGIALKQAIYQADASMSLPTLAKALLCRFSDIQIIKCLICLCVQVARFIPWDEVQ